MYPLGPLHSDGNYDLLQLCIFKLTNLLLNLKRLALLRSEKRCLDRFWVPQAKQHSSRGHAGDTGAEAALTK